MSRRPRSGARVAPPARRPADLRWLLLIAAATAVSCAQRPPLAPDAPSRGAFVAQGDSPSGPEANEVMVTLRPGVSASVVADDYGSKVVEEEGWGCASLAPGSGETALSLAQRLAGDPRVVSAEPNDFAFEPAETRQKSFAFDDGNGRPDTYAAQPATAAIRLREAHLASTGDGVRVAVLDTGAELGHPALAGRIAGGWDFVDGDGDPSETPDGLDNDGDGFVDEALGHGTHVAGIVALTAPGARLLVARVLDADGRGDILDVAAGIRWAVARGARVVNLSLGSLRSSEAVQYALEAAEDAGVVCVVSAGNWGAEEPGEYPARSSHALAVSAVDVDGRAAPFTSFGGFVAISAPGIGVRSTFPGGGWALWSGTSMAAPFVAGTAALLLFLHPDWDQGLVHARLAAAARDIRTQNPGLQDKLGAGALDAGAALLPDLPRRGGSGGRDPSATE